MAELGTNRLFVFITLFYASLFGLMGVVNVDNVTIDTGDTSVMSGTIENILDFVLPDSWVDMIYNFFGNINTTVTGLPTIVSTFIFAPLFIIGVYFLILLIIKVIHG